MVGDVLDCKCGLLLRVCFSFFSFAIASADWAEVAWRGSISREQGGRRQLVVVEVYVCLADVGDCEGVEVFGIRWIELAVLLVQIVKFLEVNASDLLDEGSCLDAALAGEPGAFRFYFGADDDHVLLLGHDVLQRLRVEGEDAVADVWAAFVVCHRQVWFGVVGGRG